MWFAAKLMFEAVVDDAPATEPIMWEESIRLLRAGDQDEAEAIAHELGRNGEVEHLDDAGRRVRWHFRELTDVQLLSDAELAHGTKVMSTMSYRAPRKRPNPRTQN